MFKDLLKDLLKELEKEGNKTEKEDNLETFHITIKHGDEVLFDSDTDCAFVVADNGESFYSTCYNNTNIGTTLTMLKHVSDMKKKLTEKISDKILGE